MTEEEVNAKCVDGIVIELKAVSTLLNVHIAQTINYLVAMKIDYGMLINFGSHKYETRKLARPLSCISCPLWLKNLGIKRRSFMV